MGLKKLKPNEKCGCGSGAKYKRCCEGIDPWFVDENGIVVDEYIATAPTIVRKVISAVHMEKFGEPLRRRWQEDRLVGVLDKHEAADVMLGIGLDPAAVYAFDKTDVPVIPAFLKFFRLTNVIPIPVDRRETDLERAFLAMVEYDRIAGGDDVRDPERATLEEIVDLAKNHDSPMDNAVAEHMMRRTGRHSCRGCATLTALRELMNIPEGNEQMSDLLLGSRWWSRSALAEVIGVEGEKGVSDDEADRNS